MTDPTDPTPQDADTQAVRAAETRHLPTQGTGSTAWTTWVPASEQRPHSAQGPWSPPRGGDPWTPPPVPPATPASPAPETSATPAAPATPQAPMAPPAPAPVPTPQVTYLPPPSGPNWGLVLIGVVFGLVGAGVVANQLTGFQVSSLSEMGPSVLVIGGLACALLGMVGMIARRRRC